MRPFAGVPGVDSDPFASCATAFGARVELAAVARSVRVDHAGEAAVGLSEGGAARSYAEGARHPADHSEAVGLGVHEVVRHGVAVFDRDRVEGFPTARPAGAAVGQTECQAASSPFLGGCGAGVLRYRKSSTALGRRRIWLSSRSSESAGMGGSETRRFLFFTVTFPPERAALYAARRTNRQVLRRLDDVW